MRFIGVNWAVGMPSGWGVFGLNLTIELLRREFFPVLLTVNSKLNITPLQHKRLMPVLDFYKQNIGRMERNPGRPLRFPVFQALMDRLELPDRVARFPGTPDIGVAFFEHTDIPQSRIDTLRDWPLIVAGSSWNGAVMRARGLGNVAVCPQGVDLSLFHPAPRQDIFPDRFVVFAGGKFEYRKGQDLVAAAFRIFQQRHPDALLVVAWHNLWPESIATMARSRHTEGLPGSEPDAMARWLAANGIPADAVVDAALLPNNYVPQVLRECDLAVFASRCEGGTNLPAMEAMACGVPVVLSANTGHLDLLGDHVYALNRQTPVAALTGEPGTEDWGESDVEELVEAMEQAYRDRDGLRRRGRQAAEVMAGWSWRSQIDRLLKVADAALAGQPVAAPGEDDFAWANKLHRLRRLPEAGRAYQRALAARPDDLAVHHDFGALLVAAGHPDEAKAHYRFVLERAPNSHFTLNNLARLHRDCGEVDQAVALWRRAIGLRPDDAGYHWDLAWSLLLQGRFAEAWPHFEHRHQAMALRQPEDKPRWDGRPVEGFRLLVLDEQGQGDTIQFARYLPLLPKGAGGSVIFAGKPSVLPLIRPVRGLDGVFDWNGALPHSQMWVPLLSLPRLLGTDAPDKVPPPGGWLAVEPERSARWRPLVRGDGGELVVGLCWRGNPKFPQDHIRSPGLAALRRILDVPGVRFVSLQVGPGRSELEAPEMAGRIVDAGGGIERGGADFRDTAAVAGLCDLVISSCTSVVHVAGSVGCPTWLLLSTLPDWRWMIAGDDTPWYPGMRLYRQPRPGDWDAVAAQAAAALAGMAAGRRRIGQTA